MPAPRLDVVDLPSIPAVGPAALTMGVFDGVHLGHRALLRKTVAVARDRGLRSVALIFDPHPDEVLRPGTRVPRLAPPEVNRARIEDDLGVDRAIALRFDDRLRSLSAEEFLAGLQPGIELRAIVMSPESAFGRGRGGTVARLRELGIPRGFEVVTVDPVLADGEVISSARIRRALDAADLEAAARMGSPPTLVGTIDDAGRLTFDYLPALPAAGDYTASLAVPHTAELMSTRVHIGGAGTPTGAMTVVVEAGQGLSGQRVELRLVGRG